MEFNFHVWLFFLIFGIMTSVTSSVETTSGNLLGTTVDTPFGHVNKYLGVPYAKAPLGELRFQPPQSLDKDETTVTRDSSRFGPVCYQPPHLKEVISPLLLTNYNNQPVMNEDCLNLNIYVPAGRHLSALPVMVWLPGEGFDYADATQFDGTFLAVLGQVIVVTVNYRVSVFGFLSTLSPEAPGNVGLLDQRLALLWIQQNIGQFNGDPNKVTFFGRFSGAMSISAHLASPLNQGGNKLFHRAILQSGVATGRWSFDNHPLNATLQLAKALNCGSTSNTVIQCLQEIPAKVLLNKSLMVPQRWRPVIDGHFLTDDPLSVVNKGNNAAVDVILGVNSDEGSLCLLSLFAQKSKMYQKVLNGQLTVEDFKQLLENNLQDFLKKDDPVINKLVAHEYQHLKSPKLRDSYMDFCGSMYITAHTEQLARLLAQQRKSKVFMYEFAHRPSFSIHPDFIQAAHGDDVLFTFGLLHQLSKVPDEELKLSRRIITAFSHFANTGNPNPLNAKENSKWSEYSDTQREVLEFTADLKNDVVRPSDNDRDVAFWYSVVPSIQENDLSASYCSTNDIKSSDSSGFIGFVLNIQVAEYIILGLVAITLILIVALFVIFRLLWSSNERKAFTKF
ncbi:acetylcholinesterase-like [Tachypleus tridentatus]|uniref:acetylcholinesterase-like n=1 Tax=Tachypleus tridentatus TaxID=6853 RepID=UPI003FD1F31D